MRFPLVTGLFSSSPKPYNIWHGNEVKHNSNKMTGKESFTSFNITSTSKDPEFEAIMYVCIYRPNGNGMQLHLVQKKGP